MTRRKLPDIDKLNKLASVRPISEAKRKLNEYHKSLYGCSIPKIGGIGVKSCVEKILAQAELEPVPMKPSKPKITRRRKIDQKTTTTNSDDFPESTIVELQDRVRENNRKFMLTNNYIEYYKPMYCTTNGFYYPINETLWNWICITDNWYACSHMYPYFSEQVHKGIQSILFHVQKHGQFKVKVDSQFHVIQV